MRALARSTRWGYGYMWWVWDAPPGGDGPFAGAYTGMGAAGQYITVLPRLDMVVAHKTDREQPRKDGASKRPRDVVMNEYNAILHMLIAARCRGACE